MVLSWRDAGACGFTDYDVFVYRTIERYLIDMIMTNPEIS